MQRVFPNGDGSYSNVVSQIPLWLKQFPFQTTKVTIGHDDLPLVKDSIIHLWNLGIKEVPSNVIFEDVWQDGDDQIFEDQLKQLADYVLENKLWGEVNTLLFSERLGYKIGHEELMQNSCGTGQCYTVDYEGKLYPCVRFLGYSLENKKEVCIGDVYNGIDNDKVRPFLSLNTKYQSPQECLSCPVSSSCAFCPGYNYDCSTKSTIFERSLSICKMHKARVRANLYYWARLYNFYGVERVSEIRQKSYQYLYILESDESVSYCNYSSRIGGKSLSVLNLKRGLEFAHKNFYSPVLVHKKSKKLNGTSSFSIERPYSYEPLNNFLITHIKEYSGDDINDNNVIYVFNSSNKELIKNINTSFKKVILTIKSSQLDELGDLVSALLRISYRVHYNIELESKDSFDIELYEAQLDRIAIEIFNYSSKGAIKEVNRLTDRIFSNKMNNCYAGERTLTLAPDGQIYLCPAFYYNGFSPIGRYNESTGEYDLSLDIEMTKLEKSPNCNNCDCYQCNRCICQSKSYTGEYNIPSTIQCKLSHIERESSRKLLDSFKKEGTATNFDIPEIAYSDPIEVLIERANAK